MFIFYLENLIVNKSQTSVRKYSIEIRIRQKGGNQFGRLNMFVGVGVWDKIIQIYRWEYFEFVSILNVVFESNRSNTNRNGLTKVSILELTNKIKISKNNPKKKIERVLKQSFANNRFFFFCLFDCLSVRISFRSSLLRYFSL